MGLIIVLLLALVVAVAAFGIWVVVTVITTVASVLISLGSHALPVLMIVLGAWLVWRALAGGRRPRHATPSGFQSDPRAGSPGAWQPWSAGAAHEQGAACGQPAAQGRSGRRRGRRGDPEPAPAGATAPRPARRELPIDVQVKAEQIQRKADLLLGYADRFPPFSQSLHIVRQTATDYLPRTLEAYLALPGLDDPLVPSTGRTALTELRAQLHLLDAKLDDITLDLQQQDLDRMSANRRFLEERFGHGERPASDAQPPPTARMGLLHDITQARAC
ncbi:MAG: hypothetical protein IT306_17305 [Chloroflexi bacterium]|nr:hypothetical protein [Chloroflexota bacterium]